MDLATSVMQPSSTAARSSRPSKPTVASSAAPYHAAHVRVDALAAASLARRRSDPVIHGHMVGARFNHHHKSVTMTSPMPLPGASTTLPRVSPCSVVASLEDPSADGAVVARGVPEGPCGLPSRTPEEGWKTVEERRGVHTRGPPTSAGSLSFKRWAHVSVSFQNYKLYRHLQNAVELVWGGDEVILDVTGTDVTEQGNCTRFGGTHNWEKWTVMVDLGPETPYNRQVGKGCRLVFTHAKQEHRNINALMCDGIFAPSNNSSPDADQFHHRGSGVHMQQRNNGAPNADHGQQAAAHPGTV
ncbi:hypothetical protein QYE76_052546 [Lolium multiflorum]|uniref:Uncharacterized protein n=1 Tax=Lolium multiflorum TaxID=4521 RepID=A0AAD8WJ07_LOLMU|nr:hypothetical protein QYE76_052546 [Lolium multiflorum]